MAKCIRTTKAKFFVLNRLMAKLPEPKSAEESLKLMSFYRNVKKALRKTLDEISDLQKVKTQKIESERKKYLELAPELTALQQNRARTPEEEEKKKLFDVEVKALDDAAAKKTKAEDARLKEIEEGLNKEELEVKFDNESFNYIEELFKKTPNLFKVEEKMDLDTMDEVFNLFDSAYVPEEK